MDNGKICLRRDLNFVPHKERGTEGMVLQDRIRGNRGIFIPKDAVPLLNLFSGQWTLAEIEKMITEQMGPEVDIQGLREFIEILDDQVCFENERYEQLKAEKLGEYRGQPARPFQIQGMGLPPSPELIKEFLDGLVDSGDPARLSGEVRGVLCPHIDFDRGRAVYSKLFSTVRESLPPERVIILGVNHFYMSRNPLIFTGKTFYTPLGEVPVETGLLKRIEERMGRDIYTDELAHSFEHSVELPLLLVRHAFPEAEFTMLPVICNFFERGDERVEQFIELLQEAVGEKTLLVASADFSHMGPFFGDSHPVREEELPIIEESDREVIRLIENSDAEGFYDALTKDGNPRHIDGLSPLYIFLRVLQPLKGRMLSYNQAYTPENTVTFTGVIWEN